MLVSQQIAVGIGGSGAKCAEALIYLCAAGLGPDELTLIFVDADRNNANLEQVLGLAKLYQQLQSSKAEEAHASPFFRTRISLAEPWSPFPAGSELSLAKHFGYNNLRAKKEESATLTATLMEAQYSAEQRVASLDVGFRGKPSIGAAVFADTVNTEQQPWSDIIQSITAFAAEGKQVRVFAMGSLFGGTGAAGLPTIPRLLRNGVPQGKENVYLGGVLLLPYFTFMVPRENKDAVYASPELFALNSKEALRYYAGMQTDYKRLYVVGAPRSAKQGNFALGGSAQKNLPHFVELVGALGAIDFYQEKLNGDSQASVLGVEDVTKFTWKDVPDQTTVQSKVGNLARLSMFYSSTVFPRLQEIKNGEKAHWRTPWYQHLLVRRNVDLGDAGSFQFFERMHDFSLGFLCWMRDLENNDGGIQLSLFNTTAFSDLTLRGGAFSLGTYKGDIVLEDEAGRIGISRTWANLCGEESVMWSTRDVGNQRAFQIALYESCRKKRS